MNSQSFDGYEKQLNRIADSLEKLVSVLRISHPKEPTPSADQIHEPR
jgi:hypothetical protein